MAGTGLAASQSLLTRMEPSCQQGSHQEPMELGPRRWKGQVRAGHLCGMLPRWGLWLSLVTAQAQMVRGSGASPGPGSTVCARDLVGQQAPQQCTCTGTIYYGSPTSGNFASLTVFATSIPCSATAPSGKQPPPWDSDPAPGEDKTCYCDPAPYNSVALPGSCNWHGFFGGVASFLTVAPQAVTLLGKSTRVKARVPIIKRISEDKAVARKVNSLTSLASTLLVLCAWVPAYAAFTHSTPDFTGCWVFRQSGVYNATAKTPLDLSAVQDGLDLVFTSFMVALVLWCFVVAKKALAVFASLQELKEEELKEEQRHFLSDTCSSMSMCPTLTECLGDLFRCLPLRCQQVLADCGWQCLFIVATALMHAFMFPVARYKWFVNSTCPAPALPSWAGYGFLSIPYFLMLCFFVTVCAFGLAVGLGYCGGHARDHGTNCFIYAVFLPIRAFLMFYMLVFLGAGLLVAFIISYLDHVQTGFEACQSFLALAGTLHLPIVAWFSCALPAAVEAWQQISGLLATCCCCGTEATSESSSVEVQAT